MLAFLAAYLQSPLARYYLFHTSGRWGIERPEVQLAELLRVPFPRPDQTREPDRCATVVNEVASRVRGAKRESDQDFADREAIIRRTGQALTPLIYEYFEIDDAEKVLVEDTNDVIIPSIQPSRASERIPTLRQSTPAVRGQYMSMLCDTLNVWTRGSPYSVRGRETVSESAGVGLVLLERIKNGKAAASLPQRRTEEVSEEELIQTLERLRKAFAHELGSVQMLRGLKVFEGNQLYVIKPLSQRFWTRTAALNDADEIAATILAQPVRTKT